MAKALEQLGIPAANLDVLLSAQATKASIESRFKTTVSALTENDSFVFFFAGHGLSITEQNYLTCHDTQRGDMAATSIPIAWIFQLVRKTKCKHVTFFLDCCHSGLPLDPSMRGIVDRMSDVEFEALFKASEHHVAFAACKPDEYSHSAMTLSHGIWTYHLLRALLGEDPDALDRGRFVTSYSLQNYLAVEVPRTLRKTQSGVARQTPCSFGNATAGFIIADLKPIIDARQAALASQATAPRDAAFIGVRYGSIKALSGFKRFHTVPKDVNAATQRFVANIGEDEVRDHTDKLLSSLRSNLGYGIKDVDRSLAGSSASLKTKDFDVNIEISQCSDEPDTYEIRTAVTNFRNPPVVATPEFNRAVSRFVDTLELQLPGKLDLEDMIARLEKSPIKDSVDIEYNADLSNVEIAFTETGVSLVFKNGICEVTTTKGASPLGLLEAVGQTQAALVTSGSTTVPLLNP